AGSSAPGTSNSALAGMISAAMARRSSRCAGVRTSSADMTGLKVHRKIRLTHEFVVPAQAGTQGATGGASWVPAFAGMTSKDRLLMRLGSFQVERSIEQVGEALLHLVGDVESQRLDRGCGVHTTGGDKQTAVDDEQVFDIVRAPPLVDDRAL